MTEALIYAGVGSRETPSKMLELIESLASAFAVNGWTLRTGGSPGADQYFYRGAISAQGRVELYLPWPGFEASDHHEDPSRGVRKPRKMDGLPAVGHFDEHQIWLRASWG